MAITKVDIPADRKPVVTFTLTDDKGLPLKVSDLDGRPTFVLAYVKEDATTKLSEYVAYTVADVNGAPYVFQGQTKQPAMAQVKGRPTFDPVAATPAFPADHPQYKDLGKGTWSYTFSTVLPESYDKSATHVVAGRATRQTSAFVVNPILEFVPTGGDVKLTRRVVATESCNRCHDPLQAHGASRRDTRLCVLCHNPQNVDPESGNTPLFKVMVHKIHNGANLPSVDAGKPYYIVGNQLRVFDFSEVQWPQDIRNCTTCHGAPPGMKAEDYAKLAPNADNWKTKPSAAACGACHDDVNFTTGDKHAGGAAKDDECAVCHKAEGGEFDRSIVGAHTIPGQSKQLKGYKVEIVRVTNTAPGQKPTVVFSAKDNSGAVVPKSDINTLSFNVKGPTTDYTGDVTTEAAALANIKTETDGSYSYSLTKAIPAGAKGTWAVGIESRRVEKITGKAGQSLDVNVYTYNPVAYVPVTDAVAVPRRKVVATENCNVCHKEIAFHGGGRKNTAEYCELCHNPANVDVPDKVPANLGGPFNVPPQSINLRFMVHRIHTGAELTRDFTIYRTRGVFNFNEIGFPGDRRNCAKCHVGTSYQLPLPATMANTLAPREPYSPLGPAASACLGCHDSTVASGHAQLQTNAAGTETCAVCHAEGREFAVSAVHARP